VQKLWQACRRTKCCENKTPDEGIMMEEKEGKNYDIEKGVEKDVEKEVMNFKLLLIFLRKYLIDNNFIIQTRDQKLKSDVHAKGFWLDLNTGNVIHILYYIIYKIFINLGTDSDEEGVKNFVAQFEEEVVEEVEEVDVVDEVATSKENPPDAGVYFIHIM
jgi:hypothetical protein